ncbi:MAG: hypothetical protein R3A80_09885 [Bdellovibrionota bacterium]
MDQEEKVIQITGSGDVLYALSSKGKLYIGTMHGVHGFEWRILPEINLAKVKQVPTLATDDDEGSQPQFATPEGGVIETAALLREEEKVAEAAPEAEAEKK